MLFPVYVYGSLVAVNQLQDTFRVTFAFNISEGLSIVGHTHCDCKYDIINYTPLFSVFLFTPPCSTLLDMTCQVANVLKKDGVKKGDRVAIYMPVSPLLVAAMLACARIGAIHR